MIIVNYVIEILKRRQTLKSKEQNEFTVCTVVISGIRTTKLNWTITPVVGLVWQDSTASIILTGIRPAVSCNIKMSNKIAPKNKGS